MLSAENFSLIWLSGFFPANPPCPGRENAYVPTVAFLALWFPGAFIYGSGGKGINKRQGEGQKLGKGLQSSDFPPLQSSRLDYFELRKATAPVRQPSSQKDISMPRTTLSSHFVR